MDLDLVSRGIETDLLGSAVESEGDLTKHQPRPGDLSAFRVVSLQKGQRSTAISLLPRLIALSTVLIRVRGRT